MGSKEMSIADKTSHFLITQYNATGDYRFEDAAKLVDEQAAKIEALEKVSQWQPIETAPDNQSIDILI
jgi:basic membrane lipoprotein Med (substrate-binding protein (PBP1-ABC) superfamily)